MLDKIKELTNGKRIKIIGHDAPDLDSIASGILLEKFFRHFDVEAEFVCRGTPDEHALAAVEYLGIDLMKYSSVIESDDLIFLVDHNTEQLENTVIGCIDHHPSCENKDYPIYINQMSSSCALTVFRLACDEGMVFSKELVRLTVLSVYMDTRSCRSTKFISEDGEWLIQMIREYELSGDVDAFKRLGYCFTDISKPICELARTDIREYVFGKEKVMVSHIQTVLDGNTVKVMNCVCEYIETERAKLGIALWVLMISDPDEERTCVLRFDGEGRKESHYDRLLSRSVDIIPMIEREFIKNC